MTTGKIWRTNVSGFSLVSVLVVLLLTSVTAQDTPPSRTVEPSKTDDPTFVQIKATTDEIDESSGVAGSWLRKDWLWTHNDSGDRARLFAIHTQTGDVSEVAVDGAKAVDWEDIASAQFVDDVGTRSLIVIADVGDNGRRRKSVQLYLVDEPSDLKDRVSCRRVDVCFPDGAGDCESVAFDVAGKRILLIKKTLLPVAGVYSVALDSFENQALRTEANDSLAEPVTAQQIATIPMPMITGMDICTERRELAIVSYRNLFVFARQPDQTWEQALRLTPKQIPLPALMQIEAVCYDSAGELWITSEGSPMPLVKIQRPE